MEIFLYTLSVMYSPGPVNFMGLNAGLTGQLKKTAGFFAGVGCAMLILFLLFGYLGQAIMPPQLLHYIALIGALYTFYMAWKMMRTDIQSRQHNTQALSFWNGLFIQLLNPKAILVILPVTAVMYPAAKISGPMIFAVSALISIGASGAPLAYAAAGLLLGAKIDNPIWFNRLNKVMAILLMVSGSFMLQDFLQSAHLTERFLS